MSEASVTSRQMTLPGLGSGTSSPESEGGASPCAWPAGPTILMSGREAALAKRTAARPEAGTLSATGGRNCIDLSFQSALALSLANRLPAQKLGLPASAMTWKPLDIGLGGALCRLAPSVRIMRESGFTLFATPTAKANQSAPSMRKWPGCVGVEVTMDTWSRRMGFPIEWLSCAPLATPSSRKLQQSSSER